MVDSIRPPSLVRAPTAEESRFVRRNLQTKAHSLFLFLMWAIREPVCRHRISCLRQTRDKLKLNSRPFREAFASCARQMELKERKQVAEDLLRAIFYCEAAGSQTMSEKHAQMLYEQCYDTGGDETYQRWVEQKGLESSGLLEVFFAFVSSPHDLPERIFADIWGNLCEKTKLALQAIFWRIVNCGCNKVEPRTIHGRAEILIQVTKGSQVLLL